MFREIQKRAVGMVSGLQQREYVERLKELRLTLFVGERHHRANVQKVHKLVKNENGLDPQYVGQESGGLEQGDKNHSESFEH
jgi:hypothetical protein